MTTQEILQAAQGAKLPLALADADTKNAALEAMAVALIAAQDKILDANKQDVENARGRVSDVMLDRLALTPSRLTDMAKGMREVAALPDPVGAVLRKIVRPNGLLIEKTAVPMGVIAIIYESRPNVTSDAAALAIKAGSACILRCGRDAWASCHAIVEALRAGLRRVRLPECAVSLIEDTSHASANELMTADGLVDLLIPRGGAGLIRACVENATVPCIQTGTGICHVYVDKAADLEMAVDIVENAKTSRPSVCNAEEALLVHRDVASQFLPMLKARLVDARAAAGITPVELHLDARAAAIIDGVPAAPQDFDTEYLDYILAVGVVDSLDAAIALDTMERRVRTGRTGTVLYMESGIDQLLHHLDLRRYRVSFDGGETVEAESVTFAVQIGPYYGGGFKICPDARIDDGLLDVCVAHPPVGAARALYIFLRAKGGKHVRFKQIELRRCRTLHLEFDEAPPAQMDGELIEGTSFDIAVEPAALNVLVPF